MDIACQAWDHGAGSVTCVDIQKPAAFGKELAAEFLGWKALTIETYDLFLGEMAAHIRGAHRGYARISAL